MKNKLAVIGALAAINAQMNRDEIDSVQEFEPITDDPFQWRARRGVDPNRLDGKLPTKPRPANHKPFIIDGATIWALNEKNAIRKAAKLNS